jgi:hypothetical protein
MSLAQAIRSVEGSLELLLDTITNTFGSVLFITMLVAILLRMSGHATQDREPTSKIEQARVAARAAELSAEIDRLKATLETLPYSDPAMPRIEADVARAMQETAIRLAAQIRADLRDARLGRQWQQTRSQLESFRHHKTH